MLNPYLEARLFELPVRPLLIEVQSEALNTVLGALRTLGLPAHNITPLFSMLGVPPVPAKLIRFIDALPGVRAVHADLESHALVEAPPFLDTSLFFPTAESRKVLEADVAESEGWTGETVLTAVIDTGIDPTHPQLQGAAWETVIQVPAREIIDKNGHGSHVSSTATGKLFFADPPGLFVEGVSSSQLLSIKALGRGIGTGFTSEIVNAMARALEAGAKVVNMSLGSEECQGGCRLCPECRAVTRLTQAGILVAIAAGNSGPSPNTIGCPGCTPEAITVAAVDKDGVVADFSSRGGADFPGKPNVAAPGVDIFSGTARASFVDLGDTQAGPGFAAISGTSMATPHVAGLLALLKHRNPGFTEAQFKDAVATNGPPFNTLSGNGIPRWSWF